MSPSHARVIQVRLRARIFSVYTAKVFYLTPRTHVENADVNASFNIARALWGVNNTLVQGNSLDHINNSGIWVCSNSDYNVLSENSIDTVIYYWILIDINCLSNTIGKNTYLGTGSVLDKEIGTIYSQ